MKISVCRTVTIAAKKNWLNIELRWMSKKLCKNHTLLICFYWKSVADDWLIFDLFVMSVAFLYGTVNCGWFSFCRWARMRIDLRKIRVVFVAVALRWGCSTCCINLNLIVVSPKNQLQNPPFKIPTINLKHDPICK